MTGWMRRILDAYGQKVTVKAQGETATVRAFLQPVTERDEKERETATPVGWVNGRLWLYLGQRSLETTDCLEWNGMTFRVRSCRPYYIGERLSHYWAALESEREAAGCGN